MLNQIKIITIFLLLSGIANEANSQDTLVVSKEALRSKLGSTNFQIKIAQKAQETSRAEYRQSNSLFLPKVELSYTAMTTTNPLMAFGSKLNQEVLTQQDFNPDLLNDPKRTDNFATQVEVQQPLLNLDGFYGRQAARAKMEAMLLSSKRTSEGVELELSRSYLTLQLAFQTVKVMRQAVLAAEGSQKMVQDYFDQGLVKKPDLLDVQVRVNEVKNEMQGAENNLRNASDYLAYLINDTLTNTVYLPAEMIGEILQPINLSPELSQSRSDIQAMQKVTEAHRKMAQSSKMKFLPRINAFGTYQLYDNEFLQADASGYLLGAQLSWRIFDGYSTLGSAEKERLNYEKAQVEADQYLAQSKLEIRKYHRQLMLAKNKVANNQLAAEQAREAYRIRKNRFSEGLEKTNDLLLSESQMFQKELEYLISIYEYTLTQEYLAFLTQ